LTGMPNIGKSTIIRKVVRSLQDKAGGFYTEEIKIHEERIGVEIVTLDHKRVLLAAKSEMSTFKHEKIFDKYRISLNSLDVAGVQALKAAFLNKKIVVVDEIDPMAILSEAFQTVVLQILADSNTAFVGTIVERPYQFADEIKANSRIKLIDITTENRDNIYEEIMRMLNNSA
jgi:nucleoside-triphosphatase